MQTEAQSYFDGVDLVTGSGERRDGKLCVMSLAALLAGEQHSDLPSTACPVITAFVIGAHDAGGIILEILTGRFVDRVIDTNDEGRNHRAEPAPVMRPLADHLQIAHWDSRPETS